MGHAYHGQQGQLLPLIAPNYRRFALVTLLLGASVNAQAQTVRDHTRLAPAGGTTVSKAQAAELTLTVTDVAIRPIQTWIRTAGVIRSDKKTIVASVSAAEGALAKVGQRVRAFPPESRYSTYQARVAAVRSTAGTVEITVVLAGPTHETSSRYVLEIVTEHGEFLSIPNEAIIETGGKQIVYAELEPGRYAAKDVQLGIQGELYTQLVGGLQPGERIVTLGSFFVDADHKLKGP